MINLDKFDKINGLVYTEKSNQQTLLKKHSFSVKASCSKKEVASIIKEMFCVDVLKVNIINTKSKKKRFRGVEGSRSCGKRAIVTLKEGQIINFGL